ncbi:MAG: glycine cleavage T C-terminal barrel domain-containing protein [Bacteroidota bacterium]|nr:glycine cleavage T C-terminal barrel domain-containing protein [Bacteroidota bacterium]
MELPVCWFAVSADRIELAGTEALDFLHRMSTAELATLPVGEGQATVFTTEKGRIKDVAFVFHRELQAVEVFCSEGVGLSLLQWLRRFLFTEDVRLYPPQRWTGAAIHGFHSDAALQQLGLVPPTGRGWGSGYATAVRGVPIRCFRVPPFMGAAAYFLLVPEVQAAECEQLLLTAIGRPLAPEQAEVFRIFAAQGRYGAEWSEEYNPLEAGLAQLVSTSKGCYVGQEVLARLETYSKVQRHLIRLWSPAPVKPSQPFYVETQTVGILTSAAPVPEQHLWIALGYVRREWGQAEEFWTEGSAGERVPLYPVRAR